MSAHQVDDRRGHHSLRVGQCRGRIGIYPDAGIVACPEHLCGGKLRTVVRNVHQHVAAVLHLVVVCLAVVALAAAIDVGDGTCLVVAGLEVDEGVLQPGLGEACLYAAVCLRVFAVFVVCIVVGTVVAAEDAAADAALRVLHVGRGVQGIGAIDFLAGEFTHLARQVCSARLGYLTAEVIAAVDILCNDGEAQVTHVHLGMAADVGIASTADDTHARAVAQVGEHAACHGAFQAAAIDVFHMSTPEVGGAAAGHLSLLSAAEGLEDVAAADVDGGVAANLRGGTVAGAEDVECRCQHVGVLLLAHNAGIARSCSKDNVPVGQVRLDVDFHVAVDIAALVAAAIDVAAIQTQVIVGRAIGGGVHQLGRPVAVGLPLPGVPLQCRAFGVPAHRVHLRAIEVEHQFPAALTGSHHDAALVGSVVVGRCHVGIVAASHYLIIYIYGDVEVHRIGACVGHAAHVSAEIERAYPRVVVHIVVEGDGGNHRHRTALHVFCKLPRIGQVHAVVAGLGAVDALAESCKHAAHHVLAVVAQEHLVGNDVCPDVELHRRVRLGGTQRGTVAAAVDAAADSGGMSGIGARHEDGHLFGIGTEVVQSLHRVHAAAIAVVIVVAVEQRVLEIGIVGVRVRAVAAAIDGAADAGMHADGIAAADAARDVVAAIDVVDVAAADE